MATLKRGAVGGGGSGRPGRMAGVDSVAAAAVDLEEERLSSPGFQGFLKGAWWEVKILERRSEMFLIRLIEFQDKQESLVPLDCLRFLDRRCDDWDCCILKTGIDVCVHGVHPEADMPRPATTMAGYDARIVSVSESNHLPTDCCCKFFVKFYSCRDGTRSLKHGGVDRVLLEDAPVKEVDISKLSILQQSGIIPVQEVLEAHISGRWGTEQGRWSSDAYSLKDTKLNILRTSSRGQESMTSPPDDFLKANFSEDGLANSGGRRETVNVQHFGASQALGGNQKMLPERIATKRSREKLQKSRQVKPIPKPGHDEQFEENDNYGCPGFAKMDGEKEKCVNSNDSHEMPGPTNEQKPTFEVFWDRIMEDSFSDSDSDMVSKKEPLLQTLWQEFDDEAPTPAAQPELHEADAGSDGCFTRCEHCQLLFKDDIGYVCGICGLVSIPVEDVLPQVDTFQRRRREANKLDDWDFHRNVPSDVSQGAIGHGWIQHEEVVNMLNKSLPPQYATKMYPHQKDGFEFLWRNIGYDAEGNLRSKSEDWNAGCILAHAPGTGKTFLVVAFLKSYMDRNPNSQALIVVPSIMLLRWEAEFANWKSGIKVFVLQRKIPKRKRRAMLNKWRIHTSVCLVSYGLFSSLTYEMGSKKTHEGVAIRKSLLESPRILVLDECHFPRNKRAKIHKALQQVKTHARILLSGTLFQNNFNELFNVLSLARPGFALRVIRDLSYDGLANKYQGKLAADHLTKVEVTEAVENKARKLFERLGVEIKEETLCKGSEVQYHARQRLQRLIADFHHRHTGGVLASLPGLRDFGILLEPTALQCFLLELVEKRFQRTAGYLERETATSETCIHPQLLTKLDSVRNDPNFLEAVSRFNDQPAMLKELADPQDGVKTKFVFDLLNSLKSTSEKVLIFSKNLDPLQMLEDMLKRAFNWDKNKEILRLDGKVSMSERETVISSFNEPCSQAQVLLASTKACGEGINLVGASRVVFLDVLWNPAIIKQGISRAFRIGQQKKVYVYILIAAGTIEEEMYKKAIKKDWLSTLIFTTTARETDARIGGQPDDDLLGPPESTFSSRDQRRVEKSLVWEVDASTCEDSVLENLLMKDKSQGNSFFKVVEHDSQFHKRTSTECCPDARQWFLNSSETATISPVPKRQGMMKGFGWGARTRKS